jgi:hypothetical protein
MIILPRGDHVAVRSCLALLVVVVLLLVLILAC